MTLVLIFLVFANPFYEANFSSLPIRSLSVFSNPGGLGIQTGAEIYSTYHHDPNIITTGAGMGNLGIGMIKEDSLYTYEVGVGYKLPGALSLGYAKQFGESEEHILGLVARTSQKFSFGYKTTAGDTFHMFGGISVRPFEEYITISGDVEYEGFDSIFNFYYGAMIQPVSGLKLSFHADTAFNWNAGLEFSFRYLKIAGAYSSREEKFSGGILVSAQSYESLIPRNRKAMKLSLKEDYPEIKRKSFFGIPIGTKQGFTKLLIDLESLIERDDIKVILVELKGYSLVPSQIEELKEIIVRLRKSGKKIVFFADSYRNIFAYELACSGDEIILSPLGIVMIPGMGIRKFYVKGTLEKLGLETDITHVGKYKSATEILTREDMSEEDREQLNKILDDIYYPTLDNIAQARKKTRVEIEELVNDVASFNTDEAKEYGLIDTTMYEFELENYIQKKFGEMAIVDYHDVVNERTVDESWRKDNPKIALIIAEGTIVPGEGKPDLFQSSLIGGDKYARIFENIKDNKDIKVVVFRINSGGGDAFASEEIAYAVKRCAEIKPVIVSMGGVAGSGGYYIACLANKIYADSRTITGSIGVLSLNLITRGLYDKLGISWDYVKKGKHSDAYWGLRHLTDDELAKEEKEVRWYYDKFTQRVAHGRNMTQAQVDSLGQGRVYSGKYAEELGLIDKTGGFLDALAEARDIAGIKKDAEIVVYSSSSKFSLFNNTNTQNRFMYVMPHYELK